MERFQFAICLATTYLVCYVLMFETSVPFSWIIFVFLLSPIPVLWTVYEILRAQYRGRHLEEHEEFGYQDKRTEDLWIF